MVNLSITGMLLDKKEKSFLKHIPKHQEDGTQNDGGVGGGRHQNEMEEYEKDVWSKVTWLYFDVANIAEPKF
jgi:hypothetical protein